jgi:hypothetical protein
MDKIEEFRANAAAALDLAERADDVEEKLRRLEVAQRWFELAMAHWSSPEWLDDPNSLPLSANDGRNVLTLSPMPMRTYQEQGGALEWSIESCPTRSRIPAPLLASCEFEHLLEQ